MIVYHHTLTIELDDLWWNEAGMDDFVATEPTYRVKLGRSEQGALFQVRIDDVGPVLRKAGVGIFNNNEEATARERVVRLLRGFREGAEIPPIELVKGPPGYGFPYKLTAGCHRLYCSLAAGFSHVPAVKGFDITAPYI